MNDSGERPKKSSPVAPKTSPTQFEIETTRAIGGLLVELRQQREAAIELAKAASALLAEREEVSKEHFAHVNQRITQALKKLRAAGTE